ncbi:MAG: hypothetical protein ABL904_21125 [Hyphomicrobiaceae bacterium]
MTAIGSRSRKTINRVSLAALLLTAGTFGVSAQTQSRDAIGDLINRGKHNDQRLAQTQGSVRAPGNANRTPATQAPAKKPGEPAVEPAIEKDPREGEAAYEQAKKLMAAIDAVLQDTARNRGEVKKLPSKDEFLVSPLWTETKEDREKKIRDLLDSALGIVTEVPVVDVQKRVEERRKSIREIEERIVKLREKQLSAPKDAVLAGVLTDTVDSLARDIEDSKKKIDLNREDIKAAKGEIAGAMAKSGIQLAPEQIDMLLDSVLSGDLVRLVAVFNSAKLVDAQLGKLMAASGDNTGAARKYFAMHAALFAMLVHAQDSLIAKIDTNYLPKLDAIGKDVEAARKKTTELLRAENRPDQKKALEANRDSQKLADEAAKGYRRYMLQQREQIAAARKRAAHDLRIADNTFETVEASFQLRNLMRDSATSFEAIQKLEAPTFEQIFKNEELRREFENLTRKLDAPSS